MNINKFFSNEKICSAVVKLGIGLVEAGGIAGGIALTALPKGDSFGFILLRVLGYVLTVVFGFAIVISTASTLINICERTKNGDLSDKEWAVFYGGAHVISIICAVVAVLILKGI